MVCFTPRFGAWEIRFSVLLFEAMRFCLFIFYGLSFEFAMCQQWMVKNGVLYPSFCLREIGFSGLLSEVMRFCLFIYYLGRIYI